MNKEYLINTCLQASIHTTTVRCRDMDNILPHIDKEIVKASYLQRSDVWSMLINPNKICGDLFSYSDFRAVMNTLFAELEVKDPTYYRTDIRIDSYADTFKQFYKINMIIIMLFAMRYQKNNGMAMGQICLQSKDYCDISYSNDYFEMKYYDVLVLTSNGTISKPKKSNSEYTVSADEENIIITTNLDELDEMEQAQAMIIAAAYDENNVLLGVDISKDGATTTLKNNAGVSYIKIFVWDSNMRPLTTPAERFDL